MITGSPSLSSSSSSPMMSEVNAVDFNILDDNENSGPITSSPRRGESSTPPMPPSTQPGSTRSALARDASVYNPMPRRTSVRTPTPSSGSITVAGMIDHAFPEFDHRKEIIEPFSEDANRDQAFQEEVTEMLLDALIESHAWSTARLKHESISAAERYETSIASMIEIQGEQEKTRERLVEFIEKMRNAIVVLTGAVLL